MYVHVWYAKYIDRLFDLDRDAILIRSLLNFYVRDSLDCMMKLGNAMHVLWAFVRDALKEGTMLEFFKRMGKYTNVETEVGNPSYVLLMYLQS